MCIRDRCKDHNNDDLRDVFCEVEHAVKLVVTEYILRIISGNPVSYTHLDVYKRQSVR